MATFTTNDSGKRATFNTGMVRDTTEGKPRFDLILPKDLPYKEQMLTRVAELMMRGAKKYDARNWEKASTQEELDRYYESAFRHFIQWICGETDEDHAAAVFFNIQGAEYVKYKLFAMSELERGTRHSDDFVVPDDEHHQTLSDLYTYSEKVPDLMKVLDDEEYKALDRSGSESWSMRAQLVAATEYPDEALYEPMLFAERDAEDEEIIARRFISDDDIPNTSDIFDYSQNDVMNETGVFEQLIAIKDHPSDTDKIWKVTKECNSRYCCKHHYHEASYKCAGEVCTCCEEVLE